MFSRTVLLACVAGSAVAIIDDDRLNAELNGYQSCGNCFKQVPSNTATTNPLRCNSGGHADKIPFSTNQDPTSAPISAGDLAEHGFNKATAMSVSMMKSLVGEEWKLMFCSSHLDMYKVCDTHPTAATPPPSGTTSQHPILTTTVRGDAEHACREAPGCGLRA